MAAGKKILIVIVVGIIVWIVYFFAYFQPKQEEIEEKLTLLNEVKVEMSKKQQIADNLPKFNRELERLRDLLRQSIEQLPNTKNVPELLEKFSSLALESGVHVGKFSIAPETVKGFYAELPINLELTGSYHNIAVFFDKIGKLERIINISNVAIRNSRSTEGKTVVSVTCLARTFRFLESEVLQ